MEKLKKFINNYYVKQFIIFLGMMFSFLIIDVYLRYFSNQYVLIYRFTHASPLFFSVSWSFLFIGLINLFDKKRKMIIYPITVVIFNLLMLAQTLHMTVLGRFFGMSDIFLASEGSSYFLYALTKTSLMTVLAMLVSISACIVTLLIMKGTEYRKKDRYDYLIIILSSIILIGGFRYFALKRLGKPSNISTWEAAYNVRLIYDEFNNQSKNMEVAGLYEQTFRNSYLYIKENLSNNKEEISKKVHEEIKGMKNITEDNEYTGIFKDKNLIFVLMETIDSFLVDEEIMPTLTKLQSEGWNFTNRYAPVFGGGQTINSEFAANTGLYTIDNSKAIYNYEHTFSYSLPSMMKKNGYLVNSLHENSGKFYNRSRFHYFLGYENHYALQDMKEIEQLDYTLDTNIIKNDDLDKYMIYDEKFMTFITTYSAHLPYNSENANCKNIYGLDVENNTELSCIRNLAHDTDEFIRLLIEKLDKSGKLDDTVLVFFTDHYAYGYGDVNYIKEYKDVDNLNLIQNVPLIIWSKDIKSKEINTIMDTADIAPTLLNLFGIEFDSRHYIGQDVFNKNRDNFVYFSNNNFYDGELYYDKNTVITKENKDYINKTLTKINKNMNLNKNIILGNYYYYLDNFDN